jgi:hypothetical protein
VSLERKQTIDVSNTTDVFREEADHRCEKHDGFLEKQQTIDVSNTTGFFREAADYRSE